MTCLARLCEVTGDLISAMRLLYHSIALACSLLLTCCPKRRSDAWQMLRLNAITHENIHRNPNAIYSVPSGRVAPECGSIEGGQRTGGCVSALPTLRQSGTLRARQGTIIHMRC